MSCLGALSAVTPRLVERLRALPPAERVGFFGGAAVESCYELGVSWDAMHRALTDRRLEYGNAHPPGCWVILGGERIYGGREGEWDHIITGKTPAQAQAVADWIGSVTEEQFREWYFTIDPAEYGMEPDDWDCGYTWEYFHDSQDFWKQAAKKRLYVIFDASQ